MKLIVRKAKAGELKRIVAVTDRAFNIPFDPAGYRGTYKEPVKRLAVKVYAKELEILVACCDGRIVGAVRYALGKGVANMSKLAVLKSFRNQKIAPALVRKVEREAAAKGCLRLTLDCMEEKNLAPYYEKLGFAVDRVVKHLDHHDVYMSKPLAPVRGCRS
jgi:predicted N-acetyltransferase YhbS